MKKWIALALALVMAFGLVACGGTTTTTESGAPSGADIPEEARYGGTLNLSDWSFNDNFDPYKTTGWTSYAWSCGVYENPIARDENGNFVPGVCNFELSEDQLTLTMWVRDGVTFHNGDPVDIDDVVASIARSNKFVSNMKKYFAPYMAGEPVVADGKVTYTFTEFNINTLFYFTHWATWCAVMPKEILDKYGDEYINDPADAIGTGPYKVVDYQTNAKIAMEKYDGYVPTTLECGGYGGPKKAYMDKVNYLINPDTTSHVLGVINGDYDRAGQLPDEYYEKLESFGLYSSTESSQSSVFAMAFNTKNPDRPTADPNLRKAIAAALDYESVAKVVGARFYSIDDLCPMSNPAYINDIFDSPDYVGASNMELAKEYLAKSSYNNEEIVLLASGEGFSTYWEDTLQELGLNVKIDYMDASSLKAYALDNSNPYDCITFSYEAKDTVPCQISVTPRDKYWGSEEKDRLFTEISKHPVGSEESLALWTELSHLWVDDCSVVNFYSYKTGYTMDTDLVYNFVGLPFWYNAYWQNPEQHVR